MAQASSYAFTSNSPPSTLEQWIRHDLRARYNGALAEAVPAELLALARLPQQPASQPALHPNGH